MSYFGIYLWTRLDVVLGIFTVAAIISGFVSSVCGIAWGVEISDYGTDSDDAKKYGMLLKRFLCILVFSLSVIMVVPCKKDMALIYVVPTLAKTETMQEIAKATPEITKLGLDVLKETLEGLKNDKESTPNSPNS